MNQTDETERALRAATCRDCRLGVIENAGWHYLTTQCAIDGVGGMPCTSAHRELLPLFQQAVAGAYAAAAKHFPLMGQSWNAIACSCGWECKHAKNLGADFLGRDEWQAHILALTPADARQAQEEQLAWHGRKVGAEAIRFVEKGTGKQHSTLADALAAAIASAEARARLAEDALTTAMPYIEFYAKREMESPSNGQEAVRETKEMLNKCRAAARTPDKSGQCCPSQGSSGWCHIHGQQLHTHARQHQGAGQIMSATRKPAPSEVGAETRSPFRCKECNSVLQMVLNAPCGAKSVYCPKCESGAPRQPTASPERPEGVSNETKLSDKSEYYWPDGSLKWGFPLDVGHLILQLQTLDSSMKVSSVMFIDINGERRPRAHGLSMSRERWDESGFLNFKLPGPECLAIWAYPPEQADLLDAMARRVVEEAVAICDEKDRLLKDDFEAAKFLHTQNTIRALLSPGKLQQLREAVQRGS